MTSPQPINEDGNLPAALRALEDAIHALCGTQSGYADDRVVYGPSKYMQLRDAVTGEQMNSGGGGGGKSRPPFWTSAFDALNEIDQTVEAWQPAFTGVPPTVGRLSCIAARRWRPMDCRSIEQITVAVQAWVVQIDELLNPTPKWSLPSPCPACSATTVYRPDGGGDMVRQPALQIGPSGCVCIKCRTTWAPERFVFLAKVLGYTFENGILE